MDLIEDSLMNDADWLSDHNIGLENTLWDTLSDKGKDNMHKINLQQLLN